MRQITNSYEFTWKAGSILDQSGSIYLVDPDDWGEVYELTREEATFLKSNDRIRRTDRPEVWEKNGSEAYHPDAGFSVVDITKFLDEGQTGSVQNYLAENWMTLDADYVPISDSEAWYLYSRDMIQRYAELEDGPDEEVYIPVWGFTLRECLAALEQFKKERESK